MAMPAGAQLPVADGSVGLGQLHSPGMGVTAAGGPPQISAGGIVNAASFQPPLARCGLATLFGTNLADTQAWAASVPLPTTLGGAQVLVNGAAAPLIYASPSQINFQVPCEVPLNGAMGIYVTNGGGMSSAQAATISRWICWCPQVRPEWFGPDPISAACRSLRGAESST